MGSRIIVRCAMSCFHAMWCCSRCTGYRPILDAFKVFAKADPTAYTEESIAASQGLQQSGNASDGPAANGHANGHVNCHANGHANGDSTNGNAAGTDGHAMTRTTDGGPAANGQQADKHAENGHSNGHDVSSSKGTVKELSGASNSSKVFTSYHSTPSLLHITATIDHSCATPMLVAPLVNHVIKMACVPATLSGLLHSSYSSRQPSLPHLSTVCMSDINLLFLIRQPTAEHLLSRQLVVVLQVCPSTGRLCDCTAGMQVDSSDSKQALPDLKPEKPPMEPIFPAELRKRQPSELHLPGPLADWYRYAAAAAAAAGHTLGWRCLYAADTADAADAAAAAHT